MSLGPVLPWPCAPGEGHPCNEIEKISSTDVDTAYITSYVDSANLIHGDPAVKLWEAKMALFGLIFLTTTIIGTLYFT